MSAELAVLNQIKQKSDLYVVSESDYNPDEMLDVSGVFPKANLIHDTTNTLDIFKDASCTSLYRFDNDATDLSGDYDGTAVNITYDVGNYNQASVYNGSTSYVHSVINNVTADITFSFWFYESVANASSVQMFTQLRSDLSSTGRGIYITTSNVIGCYTRNSSNTGIVISGTYNSDEWNHAVFTQYGTEFAFYVNGVLVGTDDTGTINTTWLNDIYFGTDGSNNNDRTLNGLIDQARIFNRGVTQDEVTALYNELAINKVVLDLPKFEDTSNILDIFNDGSYVAFYKFNGDVTDESAVYNGTVDDVTYQPAVFDDGMFMTSANQNNFSATIPPPIDVTLSYWLKTDSYNGNGIITWGTGSANYSQIMLHYVTQMYFGNGSTWEATPTITKPATDWMHIVVSINNTNKHLDIYVNEEHQQSIDYTNNIVISSTGLFQIGKANWVVEYTNGAIDQFRIFDRPVTADEVHVLYTEKRR